MLHKSKRKEHIIIYISVILVFLSIYLFLLKEKNKYSNITNIAVESVDIRNMSPAKISYKNGIKNTEDISVGQEIKLPSNSASKKDSKPTVQQINFAKEVKWQLPTKTGWVTTYPNYNHVAFDITSSRGTNETIYPIANGTISGIYYDLNGALVVTVHHYIDNTNYTSQYIHLSSYAPDLYVGKEVTINDPLGQMGSTGIATGVHLHITVADCVLFDPDDDNCKDLNGFFRYIKLRYKEGFTGLNNLVNVPNNW